MIELALFLFLILNVIDIITTKFCLKYEGTQELNASLKFLMDKIGILPALLLTKILLFTVVGLTYKFGGFLTLSGMAFLATAILVYLLLAYNNLKITYQLVAKE